MRKIIQDLTDAFIKEYRHRVEAMNKPETNQETRLLHNYKQEQIMDDLRRFHDELKKDPEMQEEAAYVLKAIEKVCPLMAQPTINQKAA